MREAASRGFWVTSYAPYGYKRVYVQDGPKKRPTLELDPPADAVVRRMFEMALQVKSILDVTKTLNAEGIPTTNGKKWLKTTIHTMLANEARKPAAVVAVAPLWRRRRLSKARCYTNRGLAGPQCQSTKYQLQLWHRQ